MTLHGLYVSASTARKGVGTRRPLIGQKGRLRIILN